MSNRSFAALLVIGTITAAPVVAAAWLLVVATVDFHDALHLSVFAAVLLHLHLARRDRRADQRAAAQAARAAWRSRFGPPPASDSFWTEPADVRDDRPSAADYAAAA